MSYRILASIVFSLTVGTSPCIAEELSAGGLSDSSLRNYINQRWLYGDSEQMLNALHYRVYQIPVNGMQLGIKKVFTKGKNAEVVSEFKAYAKKLGAEPITLAEAQQQFNLWGDCLVKSYRSEFGPNDIGKLQRYVETDIARSFPRLSRVVEQWGFEAMQRASGLRAKSASGIAGPREERLYLAIANPVDEILMFQFGNQSEARSVGDELRGVISESSKAAYVGMNAQVLAEIENYAMSDLPYREKAIYRNCNNDPAYLIKPMSVWLSRAYAAMPQYFEQNKTTLSRD